MYTESYIFKRYVKRALLTFVVIAVCILYELMGNMDNSARFIITIVLALSILYGIYFCGILTVILVPTVRKDLMDSMPYDVSKCFKEDRLNK